MFEWSEVKQFYYLHILHDLLFQDLIHRCDLKIKKYNILNVSHFFIKFKFARSQEILKLSNSYRRMHTCLCKFMDTQI